MGDDLKWFIGIFVAMFSLVGGIVARDRQVSKAITTGDQANNDKAERQVADLHERINRVREDYVRRADLDGHIQRLDHSVELLRADVKESRAEMNHRLDNIITAISKGDAAR